MINFLRESTYKKECKKGERDSGLHECDDAEREGVLRQNEWTQDASSMDPLYTQNTLEQAFPYYRERREKDEREAPMSSIHGIGSELFEEDEFLEYEGLYSEVPYGGGPSGKHLNTFA